MEYNELIKKIEELLTNSKFAVLATSNKDGIVSACQMCIVNDGLKVYFQTDSTFEKIKNIKENPHVAITIGTFNFKGIAKIVGHPTTHNDFIEKIKEKHPETYLHYTNLPTEVLIEVVLTECKIWGIDNSKDIHNEEIIQVIDLTNKTKKQITCSKM